MIVRLYKYQRYLTADNRTIILLYPIFGMNGTKWEILIVEEEDTKTREEKELIELIKIGKLKRIKNE